MKVYKKIEGIDYRGLPQEIYNEIRILAGLDPTPGKRRSLDFQLEEDDPRLAVIESMLTSVGLTARSSFSSEQINWSTYLEEKKKWYSYQFENVYAMEDLSLFQYAVVECLTGLIDDISSGKMEIYSTLAPIMETDTRKIIVDSKVLAALSDVLGNEIEFNNVKVEGRNVDHWEGGAFHWMHPLNVMPALSGEKIDSMILTPSFASMVMRKVLLFLRVIIVTLNLYMSDEILSSLGIGKLRERKSILDLMFEVVRLYGGQI